MFKYQPGQTVIACLDEYGNWGNGYWITGKIKAMHYLNRKFTYDVIDNNGHMIHNVEEILIKKVIK